MSLWLDIYFIVLNRIVCMCLSVCMYHILVKFTANNSLVERGVYSHCHIIRTDITHLRSGNQHESNYNDVFFFCDIQKVVGQN